MILRTKTCAYLNFCAHFAFTKCSYARIIMAAINSRNNRMREISMLKCTFIMQVMSGKIKVDTFRIKKNFFGMNVNFNNTIC